MKLRQRYVKKVNDASVSYIHTYIHTYRRENGNKLTKFNLLFRVFSGAKSFAQICAYKAIPKGLLNRLHTN